MKKEFVVLVTPDKGPLLFAVSVIDKSQTERLFTKVVAFRLRDTLRAQFNDADYDVYKLVKVEERKVQQQ